MSQVNGIYPLEYFSLAGTDTIAYPDRTWWSSRQRYAAVDATGNYLATSDGGTSTAEYLEIDLGRTRAINYINLDVLRAPISITVEYTADSRDNWVAVTPLQNRSFDNLVFFDGNNRTTWQNCDLFFSDAKGNTVSARYLRFSFARRDERWPLLTSDPFPWPVFVKHLRTGRYITDSTEAHGTLLIHDSTPDLTEYQLPNQDAFVTHEVRQQFVYPSDAHRGDILPRMTGLGLLVSPATGSLSGDVQIGWSLWDVTGSPALITQGTETGLPAEQEAWLDIFFDSDHYLTGDTTKTYEFRAFSLTPGYCNTVSTTSNNRLSSRAVPGTLAFSHNSTSVTTSQDTTSVVKVGSYLANATDPHTIYQVNVVTSTTITLNNPYNGVTASGQNGIVLFPLSTYVGSSYVADPSKNLVMRVWADVAESGRDVLGNTYRYGVRSQSGSDVTDPTKAGWMSAPKPTPDAVESLYFDVRGTDAEGNRTLTALNAIKINPRTPGVRMNVYFSRQNLQGELPQGSVEWDYLLWTPAAQTSYTLRRDQTIDLPTTIFAGYIKLEFTALRPLPYSLPNYPPMPPVLYNRYPTWVETQFNNAQVRSMVQDWFLRNATPVQTDVLRSLADPVREFEYEQQIFLAALASGQIAPFTVNGQLVDTTTSTIVDPVTASRIFISDASLYQNSLLLSVDQGSILGSMVALRAADSPITPSGENSYTPRLARTAPVVSSPGDRLTEAYQSLAQTPMWFNRTCRHDYIQEEAVFNKKAFFVGIQSVSLLKADYSIGRDDPLVVDDFYDDSLLLTNTWERDISSSIPDHATVYVSYNVGAASAVDEAVTLNGTEPLALRLTGGPADSVLIFSAPGQQGVQYFQIGDYDLAYGTINGVRYNFLSRAANFDRLVPPTQNIAFVDAAIVIGHGIIPQPPVFDSATVIGKGFVSGGDTPFVPSYGTGTYGSSTGTSYGSGIYGAGPYGGGVEISGVYSDLRGRYAEAATIIGQGHPSGTTFVITTDASTVTGQGRPGGTDILIRFATQSARTRVQAIITKTQSATAHIA